MTLDEEERAESGSELFGIRLARLEEKHGSLSVIVHEDHNVVVLLKDAISAMKSNIERLTDLMDTFVTRAKTQDELNARRDIEVSAIRLRNDKEKWAWGIAWKILAGVGLLFISMNSGGDLIMHHLFGFHTGQP